MDIGTIMAAEENNNSILSWILYRSVPYWNMVSIEA